MSDTFMWVMWIMALSNSISIFFLGRYKWKSADSISKLEDRVFELQVQLGVLRTDHDLLVINAREEMCRLRKAEMKLNGDWPDPATAELGDEEQ